MADRLADILWLKDHGQTPKLSKAEKAKAIKSTQNKTITYKTFALNKSIIPVTGSVFQKKKIKNNLIISQAGKNAGLGFRLIRLTKFIS